MTRKEAIKCLKSIQGWIPDWDDREDGLDYWDAIEMAISALTPPTQEQLERVRGEWVEEIVKKCDWKGKKRDYYQPHSCSKCHTPDPGNGKSNFCSKCGAPMTDKALEELRKRLEELNDGSTTN